MVSQMPNEKRSRLKTAGLVLLVVVVGLPLALFFNRLPQAAFTWIFPNDYVYRFTLTVELDGKTYTGDTVAGCREERSALPDALNEAFGSYWFTYRWATPLTVALPDGRFLFLPPRADCSEMPFRPIPAWRSLLGLVSGRPAAEPRFDPFGYQPILFDDAVAPRAGTMLLTRQGAESLGLKLSLLTIGPATWREVTDNLERNPGAPWLAPIVEECMRAGPERCRLGQMAGYGALRMTLPQALEVPAFAAWADQADRSQELAVVPERRPNVAGMLASRFERPRDPPPGMLPDWAEGRWLAADQRGLLNVVYWDAWLGGISEPILCLAADRCVQGTREAGRLAGFVVVDWTTAQVLVASSRGTALGLLAYRGMLL